MAALLTSIAVPARALASDDGQGASGDEARITLFDITDFHGHIEQGPAVASAWQAARAGNPDASLFVSAGDLVGGSPYDSAAQRDQPTLDMARSWGLSVSAMGNHELDRGVDDFNGRIAAPANGIGWVGSNVKASGAQGKDRLPRLHPYVTRTVAGKRVAFIGAVTDALFSVEEPRALEGIRLTGRAVEAVNEEAARLSDGDESNGEADAIVALIHEDADAIADSSTPLSPAIDLVYAGHSHAIKTGRTTPSGAPIIEAGSYGRAFACQDLLISGHGRDARVRVENTPFAGGAGDMAGAASDASGRVRTLPMATRTGRAGDARGGAKGDDGTARDLVRSGGAGNMAAVTAAILTQAKGRARSSGDRVVGHLAPGADFAVPAAHHGSGKASRDVVPAPPDSQLGSLIADAALESAKAQRGTRSARARVGFVNFGSLRVHDLDADGDGVITERETHTMMALQFRNATIDMTGSQLKQALAQQWRADATRMSYLGISSNVDYGYHASTDASGRRSVTITGLTVDGRPVRDGEAITVAGNSFLLNGGDGYTAFRQGRGYRDTGVPYADTLDALFARTPTVGTYFA